MEVKSRIGTICPKGHRIFIAIHLFYRYDSVPNNTNDTINEPGDTDEETEPTRVDQSNEEGELVRNMRYVPL